MAAGPSYAEEPLNEQSELSAVELQQQYYETRGDADWELYEEKDRKYLLQKIAVAICGPPTQEGNLVEGENLLELQGYDLRSKEICNQVFKKICEQEIYSRNGKDILVSMIRVIYVCPSQHVPLFKFTPKDYWVNLHLKRGKDINTGIFHVFCARKCIPIKNGEKGCRVYIDHDARVYKDWNNYLETNNLPKGVLVVPEDGEYKGTVEESIDEYDGTNTPQVRMSIVPTPALGFGARVLDIADTASIVAPIGAIIGVVGALAVPVAAPIAMATATGVGVGTGLYGIARSSFRLADRSQHEQTIGITDAEARGCWINIAMSTLGLSFSAAGKLLSMAASSGTNLTVFINALQFFKYTSIATGFIGIVNSLGEMIHKYYKYEETPTKLELFQFTSSLLFFGIGVMSNQTAQDIVQDAQAKKINEIRDSLSSNAKRKIFDKVTAETRRVKGTINGNSDVIRGLKNIENKDDFFAKLGRINKEVNKNKVRISIASDGSPIINNQHKVSIVELDSLGKDGRNQLFSKYGKAKVTTKNAPTRIYSKYESANCASTSSQETSFQVQAEDIIKIVNFLVQLSRMETDFLAQILSNISEDIHDNFLLLCAEIILSLTSSQTKFMSSDDRDFRIRIVYFVFHYLKSLIGEVDPNDTSFVNLVKMFFINGKIDKETILNIQSEFLQWWNKRKITRRNGTENYDSLDLFMKTNNNEKKFMMIRAGEVIKIGKHDVIVKLVTIEKLEEWLAGFDQHQCDIILEFTFKIISALSMQEVENLFLVNPDEDPLMQISGFLVRSNVLAGLVDIFTQYDVIDEGIVLGIKSDLVIWCENQKIRKHEICNTCKCLRYLFPIEWQRK